MHENFGVIAGQCDDLELGVPSCCPTELKLDTAVRGAPAAVTVLARLLRAQRRTLAELAWLGRCLDPLPLADSRAVVGRRSGQASHGRVGRAA
jgi:hypothetical protein